MHCRQVFVAGVLGLHSLPALPLGGGSMGAIAIPALGPPVSRSQSAAPGTTKVNAFMSYDSGARTVAITLIAALNSAQGGFNFNGGSSGNQVMTVPAGWTVNIDFHNHDAIPHSAIVVKDQTPIPAAPSDPAFPRAYTNDLVSGLPAQTGHDTMQFTATPAGSYLIACGVPGHAPSGMYIRLVVSPTAKVPSNTGTIGAGQ
jgi:sulfocyanin